jgi:hypothetical protein
MAAFIKDKFIFSIEIPFFCCIFEIINFTKQSNECIFNYNFNLKMRNPQENRYSSYQKNLYKFKLFLRNLQIKAPVLFYLEQTFL